MMAAAQAVVTRRLIAIAALAGRAGNAGVSQVASINSRSCNQQKEYGGDPE